MKRKEGAFWIVQAAIFVAVLALVALPMQSANQGQISTCSTLSEGPLACLSPVSPQGLQLKVTLNSSSTRSHGAIRAKVEVLNTLDRNVSISGLAQNQNVSGWNSYDYACPSSLSLFVGFALFRGHFTSGNISAAGSPLQLFPPEVIYCAPAFSPGALTFLPDGDKAIATIGPPPQQSYRTTVDVNATTSYCTESGFSDSSGNPHPFMGGMKAAPHAFIP